MHLRTNSRVLIDSIRIFYAYNYRYYYHHRRRRYIYIQIGEHFDVYLYTSYSKHYNTAGVEDITNKLTSARDVV